MLSVFRNLLQGIFYVLVLIAFLFCTTIFFPLGFFTNCSVTNNTNQTISVTPVGVTDPAGTRDFLPLWSTSFPFHMLMHCSGFEVKPGETWNFIYDMDDINYSELVVESNGKFVGQFIVNPTPTTNQFIVPPNPNVSIQDFESLQAVPLNIQNLVARGDSGYHVMIIYSVSFVLIIAFVAFQIGRTLVHKKQEIIQIPTQN